MSHGHTHCIRIDSHRRGGGTVPSRSVRLQQDTVLATIRPKHIAPGAVGGVILLLGMGGLLATPGARADGAATADVAEPAILPPTPTWYHDQASLASLAPSLAQLAGAHTLDSGSGHPPVDSDAAGDSRVWLGYLHGDGRLARDVVGDAGTGAVTSGSAVEHRQQVAQVGVALFRRSSDRGGEQRLGVWGAAGRSMADARMTEVPGMRPVARTGEVEVDSRLLGLYWTAQRADGTYIDAVLQYGTHDIDLHRAGGRDRTEASGPGASLELGRRSRTTGPWSWTPQVQLRWQQLGIDTIAVPDPDRIFGTEEAGRYHFQDSDSWQARVGLAVRYQSRPAMALWARGDVRHEFAGDSHTAYRPAVSDAVVPTFTHELSGTRFGLTLGLDARLGRRASLMAAMGHEQATGRGNDTRWNARIGLRADW